MHRNIHEVGEEECPRMSERPNAFSRKAIAVGSNQKAKAKAEEEGGMSHFEFDGGGDHGGVQEKSTLDVAQCSGPPPPVSSNRTDIAEPSPIS